jgi:hypothetical protein
VDVVVCAVTSLGNPTGTSSCCVHACAERPSATLRLVFPPRSWSWALTDHERAELLSVRGDLQAEEADQQSDRGHASARILRAIARLDRLLEASPAPEQHPATGGPADRR